jgi:hypothetical protein
VKSMKVELFDVVQVENENMPRSVLVDVLECYLDHRVYGEWRVGDACTIRTYAKTHVIGTTLIHDVCLGNVRGIIREITEEEKPK